MNARELAVAMTGLCDENGCDAQTLFDAMEIISDAMESTIRRMHPEIAERVDATQENSHDIGEAASV